MTERAEALAQLSRLLGDEALRGATPEAARQAVGQNLAALVDGLVEETAASDDVFDRESAASYLEQRLQFLAEFIEPEDKAKLAAALRQRIEKW